MAHKPDDECVPNAACTLREASSAQRC